VIVTEAARAPEAVGENVTLIAQFDPAARLVAQLFVCEKSPALVPVIPIELIESVALPLFVSVTVCGLLVVPVFCPVKVKLAKLRLAPGAPPIPVRLTDCGLLLALSEMVIEAVRVPAAVGLNTTLIAQLVPAARLAPQEFVCEKSPLFAPVTAIERFRSVDPPPFVTVTTCAGVATPTGDVPNVRDVLESPAEGPVPVPEPVKPSV
jgi:hypothetical protein